MRRFERLGEVQQRVQIGRHVGAIDQAHRDSKDRRCAQVSESAQCFEKLLPILRRFRAQRESVVAVELEIVSRAWRRGIWRQVREVAKPTLRPARRRRRK